MGKSAALTFVFLFLGVCWLRAANCEVSRYSTTIQIVNNRVVQTDTVIIRINNRAGEIYSDVTIPYYRDNPLQNLNAWITDKNGIIIRNIRNKEIKDMNYFTDEFYSEYFAKSFTMKHTEYPYYIAYTYQTTEKQYLTVARWQPVIGLDVPTRSATLTLIQPEYFKVNVIQNQIDNPRVSSVSDVITQQWHASYDGMLRMETYCANPWELIPRVIIIPVEFSYGVTGSTETWQTLGNWQSSLLYKLDELPESEIQLVKKLVKGITDKREIVKVLYNYLQDHTRYIFVQIGIGGMKPYPASYVAQNKFGDCKALSIYMKALLKIAGINSYYILVNAGTTPERFYQDIPFQQFNHAMIAVPLDNDTIWLENTNNSLPFGYYGIFTQNRPALLIDGDNSRLVHIPPLNTENSTSRRKFVFTLNEDGGTRVDAVFTFRGAEFEGANRIMMSSTIDDQNEVIHDYLPFRSFDLYDWKMIKQNRDDQSVKLTVSAEINQIINPLGEQFYYSFQPAQIPDFESPANRKLPLQISYPLASLDTIIYRMPGKTTIVEKPADKKIDSKFGKYEIQFTEQDNALIIYRKFILNPVWLEPDEYPDFYNFISAIKSHEKLKILFQ